MAESKLSRSDVDRFSGHAITGVSVTPAQKKAIAAYNSQQTKKPRAPKKTTRKK